MRARKVAIYARVSTDEDRQNPETQLLQLREYAKQRHFEAFDEYVEHASGRREDRPRYKAMLEVARRRKVDVVLVWRYDRFARSMQALVNALNEFHSLGVNFISYQENIDTTTPQGELIFGIMASLAQFESSLISERVKAGMKRAKSEGKKISRPRISPTLQGKIRELHNKKLSINQIRKDLGVSYGTAWNYLNKQTYILDGNRLHESKGRVGRRPRMV